MRRRPMIALVLVLGLLPLPALAAPQAAQEQRRRETAAERRERRELEQSVERFRARVEAILSGRDTSIPAPRAAPPRPAAPAEEPPPTPEELRARIPRGHWGLLVADAETGRILYARNAASYFTPASNTKLYTTALALATLGAGRTFTTVLETSGRLDARGRLLGELVLAAGGDPNLSNRVLPYDKDRERDGPPEKVLAALAGQVAAAGVRQIEGDIVAEDPFPPERYPPGWAIEDMTAGYGAPVSGIVAHDNALFVEIRPGDTAGAPAWFAVEPWAEFYEFTNRVTTTAAGGEERVRVRREPGARAVTLEGAVPLGAAPLRLTVAVEEPAGHTAALLKRLLEARGIRVYGRALSRAAQPAPAERPLVLARHTSVPLAEAVRVVNKVSQNLHAEVLLRHTAQAKAGEATVEKGLEAMEDFLAAIGVEKDHVALHDGSGLSRRNLITPQATVKLLLWAAQQPWGAAYRASLPVAGEDGTLAERMRGTAAAGRVSAKTGTLGSTNALSGYATTLSGRRLVFSLFGNLHNLRGRPATDVLDAICAAMVEEIGSPPKKR